jgi:hypothetical protein
MAATPGAGDDERQGAVAMDVVLTPLEVEQS